MTEIRKEFSCSACIVICFRPQIELPEGNTAICRNVSLWMDNFHTKIYRVYLKHLDVFQEWIPHAKRRKNILINIYQYIYQHISMYINVCFEKLSRFSPTMCGIPCFRFLSFGIIKNPLFSATVENEGKLQQRPLMPAKTFVTSPGFLKGCDMPCSDLTIRTLIEVQDILSTGWELSFDKQYELNYYSIVNVYCKCII